MKIKALEKLWPRISQLYHRSKALPENTILLVQSSVYVLAAALTAVFF
jgi:hypothetical protein